MASISDVVGKRLYLDANVFIYALESLSPWMMPAQRILDAVDAGHCPSVTSELTLAECLTKPFQRGQHENARLFEQAIQTRPHFIVSPISREVLIEAARLRASTGLKLPDAIHVASAYFRSKMKSTRFNS
jgi:predicted nucleic acid-binding protein